MDEKNEKVIPEEIIEFEDRRPYHEIEMYKKLVQFHIGLQVRSMTMGLYTFHEPFTPIKGSFPKPEEVDTETYKRCDNPDASIQFPISANVEFIYIGEYQCFFMLCLSNVHIFRYQRTLFIIFEAGERTYGIHKLKDTYYNENQSREYKTIDYDVFYQMIQDLYKKKQFDDINQLVLSGHSNGMAAATLFSYLLCCAKDNAFFELQNQNDFDELSLSAVQQLRNLPLQNITLFVVGTGGFPILFETKDEFKNYYNAMKGRYVHIVSGYKKENTVMIDGMASYLMGLLNFKFSLYYVATLPSLGYFANIFSDYPKDKKYKGIQCNFDVIIDDIVLDPDVFVKKDIHKDFYLIYNNAVNPQSSVDSEDDIQPLCERIKRENEMYARLYPHRKKDFEDETKAICDYANWLKKKLGSHDLRYYEKKDTGELYDMAGSEIYMIKKDGVDIKYLEEDTQLTIGIHQMQSYRSILSIYFFS